MSSETRTNDHQNAFHTTPGDERRTRRPEEVGAILGVGRNGVYDLIRRGRLRSISVGRKILIPLSAIDEFLAAE